MASTRHYDIMCLWILIIAMLAVPSLSKKDQLYHQLSSVDNKEERIIGGSFVSVVFAS